MLKHTFRLVKVVDGCQGYTSVVELATIPEEWIDHPQFGRCRITSYFPQYRKNGSIIHSMAVVVFRIARK